LGTFTKFWEKNVLCEKGDEITRFGGTYSMLRAEKNFFQREHKMKTCFCHNNLWLNFRKPINSSGKAKFFSLFVEKLDK
jgi:hypothetical protein